MDLYEDAYGLTRIRVAVHAVDLWLAGVFVAVMAAGVIRRGGWLPRAVAALSICGLVLFNLSNPDARMARSAVERWEETGEIDAKYLQTLGADALPELAALPPDVRVCATGPMEYRTAARPDVWSSFNLARRNARRLIPTLEEGTCS
jgi:hypothetical protein